MPIPSNSVRTVEWPQHFRLLQLQEKFVMSALGSTKSCHHRCIMFELCQAKTVFLLVSLSLLLSHSVCGESGIKKDCSAVGSI